MRRLLDKRGSVLFLVVVVMSILIIAASATYYIVNNQHSSVNVRYSSEQSYQTAVSVSDTVSDYIDGYLKAISMSGNEMSDYNNTIIGKMLSMSVGGTQNITGDIDLTSSGMGDADIVISKTGQRPSGDKTIHTYEITTSAEVNGETVKIVQVKEIISGPTDYFTRFFTSTGHRPEDVVIRSSTILTDVYFENDFSTLLATMKGSIYASGALHDSGVIYSPGMVKEIVVGENFIADSNLSTSTDADYIYVGGDYTANAMPKADEVYVLGDFYLGSLSGGANAGDIYINGDCYIDTSVTNGATFYVNGNLYFKNVATYHQQGTFYVKKNVYAPQATNWDGSLMCSITAQGVEYVGDVIYPDGTTADTSSWTGFSKVASLSASFDDDLVSDKSAYISSSVSKGKYQTWDAEQYYNNNILGIDEVITPGVDNTVEVSGRLRCTITDSCRLRSWADLGSYQDADGNWKWSYGSGDIIIDTGTKGAGGHDIYIYLDSDGRDYFTFGTDSVGYGGTNVLVTGDYSVIFVLPENTDFKLDFQVYIGHMDLALQLRGQSSYDSLNNSVYNGLSTGDIIGAPGESGSLLQKVSVDSTTDVTIFDTAAFTNSPTHVHNNIFLVTKGKNNVVDFSNHGLFCGFVYAPDSILMTDPGMDEQKISVLGGMIIGSYAYRTTTRVLAFTSPYDYVDLYGLTKPNDIVKYLINFANSGGVGSPGGDSVSLQGWRTAGYK
ncbi:MAG: hypothetical protein NC394_03970 [Bacteroides sp.]|nr:hypothetical protein [Bacteroides sp.]